MSSGEGNVTFEDITAARWNFHEYSTHITVMIFLLVMILIKIAYHKIPHLAEYMPESLLLIVVGIAFGAVVRHAIHIGSFDNTVWNLTPTLFFDYLLPPIILEASYSLYNRTFSEYLGVVLIFAVLGTVFNFLIIGFGMYGMFKAGAMGGPTLDFDLKGFLLFSSLIVAVDPVAVLAIFQDIGVELSLYYIVFGESLLNDAITVVLYDIMSAFAGRDAVSGQQIGVGIASFFTVSLGGLLIGVIFGVLTCLITRIKSHLHAFTLLLMAYFSYIMADTVGWSGIISMIGCGLVQAAYAFHNLDRKSVLLVHQLTKLVAEVSESVIFLFLGVEVFASNLEWHTGFILWALVFCLLARAIVVFAITAVVNAVRVDGTKTNFAKQLILIYGGLRGAVAFSLAVLVEHERLGDNGRYNRRVIITATLFIILFTVGFMGMTMKPLVKLLKIRMQAKEKLSLFGVLNSNVIDETMAAVETIVGSTGRNVVRDFFIRLDEKYLRRVLQNNPETYDERIMKVYEKISLKLHFATMRPDKMDDLLRDIPDTLKQNYINSKLGGHEMWSETSLNREDSKTGDQPILAPVRIPVDEESSTDNAPSLMNYVRSDRKASLAPYGAQQVDFGDMVESVMRMRNRAMNRYYIQNQKTEFRDRRNTVMSTVSEEADREEDNSATRF